MPAKILLVEDDNNLREIYEARLQAEGYTIVTARDGEEALGVAKAEMPDLIVSDVMMPRVSGFEMLDILRNTEGLKDTKVIMLTALGQADDKTRANSLGADRYLVKSQVTLEDIVKASHELLEGAVPQVPAPAASPATAPTAAPTVAAPSTPVASAPVAPMPAVPPALPVTSIQPSPAIQPEPVATPPQPTEPSAPMSSAPSEPVSAPSQPWTLPTPAAAPAVPAPEPAMPPLPGEPAPPQTPAPMPTTSPTAMPDPSTSAPTTSEEQAAIGAQIDQFVQQPVPAAAPTVAAQDDAVLAHAMHDLASDGAVTPEPPSVTPPAPTASEPPASAPAPSPAEPVTQNDSVTIANKKIIQPISGGDPKPPIHELLAREQAAGLHGEPVLPPAPATTFSPTPAVPAAGPVSSVPTDPMAPSSVSPAPQPPNESDPNNISL